MSVPKVSKWVSRPSRKLRVVFVDDSFWGYVDLPKAGTAQKRFENDLRDSTSGTVSLYHPGSPYRDFVTPPLDELNLHVFEDRASTTEEGNATSGLKSTDGAKVTQARSGVRYKPPATRAGSYTHWWMAMAAVPANRTETDWWAAADGRASRYERLKRVWFDTTRNFWFYRADQEDHLTATLWENLALFHPSNALPMLFAAAGLEPPVTVTDACWSYEFEERVDGHLKQVDVTVHYRDAEGDAILVVEAKRPGGPLKTSDADPAYYLDLPSFGFARRKSVIYLLDGADVPAARSIVRPSRVFTTGFLSWQALGELQVELAASLDASEELRGLAALLLRWQFGQHRLVAATGRHPDRETALIELLAATDLHLGKGGPADVPLASTADRAAEQIRHVLSLNAAGHVKNFIAGAIQYQCCTSGTLPTQIAWQYLLEEPSQSQIIPGMGGRQRSADRRKTLWRIPNAEH